jgi:ferredoxin-NADP reductase
MATRGVNSGMKATRVRPPRPAAWQAATAVSIRDETPTVKTIRFAVGAWPGHLPGQHADVRLIADDGYRAERSYSIASPPEASGLELTVERLQDGEVSPFLVDQLQPGDTVQLRGPIGGYFVWTAEEQRAPLMLVAGGIGIVPLMCMLRHRKLTGGTGPAALLYSARTRDDVVYHDELTEIAAGDPAVRLRITLTRDVAPGWSGSVGRIDLASVQALLLDLGGGVADCFVCGSARFVEFAAALLVQAGQPVHAIRTERFGPSGSLEPSGT